MAVSVLGLWLWYFGVVGALLRPTQIELEDAGENDPVCDDLRTFFFGEVGVRGEIRVYYIFLCICCVIYFGIMMAVSVVGPWTRLCKMRYLAKYKFFKTSSRLKYATGFSYIQLVQTPFPSSLPLPHTLLMNTNNQSKAKIHLLHPPPSKPLLDHLLHLHLRKNSPIQPHRIHPRFQWPHFFPSQLLPMVIGLCSLLRVLYLRLEKWRSPGDTKPSLATKPETPTRAATKPSGKDWLRVLRRERVR